MIALVSVIATLATVVGAPSSATSPRPTPSELVRPYQLPASFRFTINGATVRNAQTIDGLSAFVVEYRSGDVWSPRIKAPGKSKWAPITLKRGITSDNSLFEWRQKVIEGKIDEARSTCTIDAQTPGGSSYEIVLLSCWPSSYQGPQRTTSAFQGPDSVTIQFDSAEVRR